MRAFTSSLLAEQMRHPDPAEPPMMLFLDKNPLMQQVAESMTN